jgi:uncharacterized protein
MGLSRSVAAIITLAAGLHANSAQAKGTQPSFDCLKAATNAEELVCADAALAAIDRRLAKRFADAVDMVTSLDVGADEALETLRATQRGWIKGRDECWKADDLRACVETAYLMRENELVARWMLQEPASITFFVCDGNPANEIAAYFYDTELPSVRLEYGDSIDIGSLTRTASGSRYDASYGRFIWIKGDEAAVSRVQGEVMACVMHD